jgi:predicted DNA-binding protein
MQETKVTTIRQSAEQANELKFLARVDGVPVSEAIRLAIAEHIERRRNDPDFQLRLKTRIEADQNILRRLAE